MSQISWFKIHFTALARRELEMGASNASIPLDDYLRKKLANIISRIQKDCDIDASTLIPEVPTFLPATSGTLTALISFSQAAIHMRFRHREYAAFTPEQFLLLRLNDVLGIESSAPEAPRGHVTKVQPAL